jgi:hypothetical protein
MKYTFLSYLEVLFFFCYTLLLASLGTIYYILLPHIPQYGPYIKLG